MLHASACSRLRIQHPCLGKEGEEAHGELDEEPCQQRHCGIGRPGRWGKKAIGEEEVIQLPAAAP